jgi:hypothetical protein
MGRKWVYKPGHPKANERGFVAWEDYGGGPETKALDAPVMSGRFYENVSTIDGKDIGSRQKYRNYMKEANVTHSSDFSPEWVAQKKASEERQESKERREVVAKAWWQNFER